MSVRRKARRRARSEKKPESIEMIDTEDDVIDSFLDAMIDYEENAPNLPACLRQLKKKCRKSI